MNAHPLAIALASAGATILSDGFLADKVSTNRAAQIGVDIAVGAIVGMAVHFLFRRSGAPQGG